MKEAEPLFSNDEEMREMMGKFAENGRTFKDFTSLTPESMEAFYMVAYTLYNGKKYEDAEKVFKLLCTLDHFQVKYWKGLAASRENLKDYDGALAAYSYITMMDIHDPYPPFHGAKCLLALGRTKEGESALRATVFNAEGKPEFDDLSREATVLLEVIEKGKQTINTTES